MLKNLEAKLRLLISAVVFGLVLVLLPPRLPLPTRVIMAWDSGALCLLALLGSMMFSATPQKMRRRARNQSASRWVILFVVVGAACASLLAIGLMLKYTPKGSPASLVTLHLALSALTIISSWLLIHTLFALHYAHDYYRDDSTTPIVDDNEGLDFPSEKQPDYWDFLYFSFVIGMTCQVSDVQITSRFIRRLSLVHGVLSFFFNTVILALSINLVAGVL